MAVEASSLTTLYESLPPEALERPEWALAREVRDIYMRYRSDALVAQNGNLAGVEKEKDVALAGLTGVIASRTTILNGTEEAPLRVGTQSPQPEADLLALQIILAQDMLLRLSGGTMFLPGVRFELRGREDQGPQHPFMANRFEIHIPYSNQDRTITLKTRIPWMMPHLYQAYGRYMNPSEFNVLTLLDFIETGGLVPTTRGKRGKEIWRVAYEAATVQQEMLRVQEEAEEFHKQEQPFASAERNDFFDSLRDMRNRLGTILVEEAIMHRRVPDLAQKAGFNMFVQPAPDMFPNNDGSYRTVQVTLRNRRDGGIIQVTVEVTDSRTIERLIRAGIVQH